MGELRRRLVRSRMAGLVAWVAALSVVAVATVRGFELDRGYPLVPLVALAPYFVGAGLGAVAVALLVGRRLPAALAGLAALALCAMVLPRTVPGELSTDEEPVLEVLSANLGGGSAEIEELAAMVTEHGTDLLAVQELTPAAARAIRRSEIRDLLPFALVDAAPGAAGIAIYSARRLGRRPVPQLGGIATMRARVRLPERPDLDVWNVHPPPPTGADEVSANRSYLDGLPRARRSGLPRVLLGDFNATLDNSALRQLLDRGYADVADGLGEGLEATWPGDRWPPPVAIDHVLVGPGIEASSYEVEPLGGSDHRAVLTGLVPPAE